MASTNGNELRHPLQTIVAAVALGAVTLVACLVVTVVLLSGDGTGRAAAGQTPVVPPRPGAGPEGKQRGIERMLKFANVDLFVRFMEQPWEEETHKSFVEDDDSNMCVGSQKLQMEPNVPVPVQLGSPATRICDTGVATMFADQHEDGLWTLTFRYQSDKLTSAQNGFKEHDREHNDRGTHILYHDVEESYQECHFWDVDIKEGTKSNICRSISLPFLPGVRAMTGEANPNFVSAVAFKVLAVGSDDAPVVVRL